MNKTLSSLILGLCLSSLCQAQEFGSEATVLENQAPTAAQMAIAPNGQGESAQSIVAEQEIVVPKSDPSPEQQLRNYARQKKIKNGYDEKKNRIVVIHKIDFDIRNPKVSSDFINLKQEKMKELLLSAKAQIIETIFSSMSGEQILNIPGNPIAKQVEKAFKTLDKQLEQSKEDLAQLGFNLKEAKENKDSLNRSELMAIISSWFTAKDKENFAAKLDANKKEAYQNAKEAYLEAVNEYEALKDKADSIKGTISKELKSKTTSLSIMPIFGCTILQQAERIVNKNGKYNYEVAIMYTWSNEMQEAAGQILKGHSVEFAKGKRSIDEWLDVKAENGSLATWLGPRSYIDNEGNLWFIGISCAPTDDDADNSQENLIFAEETAKAEVMYSLFADVSSQKTTQSLMQARRIDATGENESTALHSIAATIAQSYKAGISGLSKLYSDVLIHEPSGLEMHVVVYGLNSGSVKALKDIQTKANSLGVKVNTAMEYERGRQLQMRKAFKASKDNPQARRAGAEAARKEMRQASEQRAEKRKPSFVPSQNTQNSKTKGELKTGVNTVFDDEDEL